MAPRVDLVIDQGAAFAANIAVVDYLSDSMNLTGYAAASSMKKWYTSTNSVAMTTSVNANAGIVGLSLTANSTAAIWPGRYVYDVYVTPANGASLRIAEGIVTVTPGVTPNTVYSTIISEDYSNTFSNSISG